MLEHVLDIAISRTKQHMAHTTISPLLPLLHWLDKYQPFSSDSSNYYPTILIIFWYCYDQCMNPCKKFIIFRTILTCTFEKLSNSNLYICTSHYILPMAYNSMRPYLFFSGHNMDIALMKSVSFSFLDEKNMIFLTYKGYILYRNVQLKFVVWSNTLKAMFPVKD